MQQCQIWRHGRRDLSQHITALSLPLPGRKYYGGAREARRGGSLTHMPLHSSPPAVPTAEKSAPYRDVNFTYLLSRL